jgi:chromatin remodeling complex protein RSC6
MSSEISTLNQNTTNNETGVSLNSVLQELTDVVNTMAQQSRDLQRNFKRLLVELEREQKRSARVLHSSRVKRTVVQKPVQVSQAMTSFLSSQAVQPTDGGFTRQTMMKAVSKYIQTKKLQLEEDKKSWKPDATLCKLFGLDKTQVYTFMRINGLLSRVVSQSA